MKCRDNYLSLKPHYQHIIELGVYNIFLIEELNPVWCTPSIRKIKDYYSVSKLNEILFFKYYYISMAPCPLLDYGFVYHIGSKFRGLSKLSMAVNQSFLQLDNRVAKHFVQ